MTRLAAVAAALLLCACSVDPVDFSDKTCPCDQGFVCDTARDRCVEMLPGDGGADAPDTGVLEGLVAYYPLDENPATAATDPTGSGPTLQCGVEGVCPSSAEGRVGRAFAYRGNEAFMVGVDDGRLVTPVAFTATVFIRPAALTRGVAFAKLRDSAEPGAITWSLVMDAAGRAGFAVGNDSDGDSRIWSEPFSLSVDTWAHLAGTWDGIAMRLYVDGVEVATGAGVADSSRGDLLIGGSGASAAVLSFNGEVDEARLYEQELEAEAVGLLANP